LHCVFDLWADQWRRRHAQGDVVVVRFADDFVVGFEYREDAERFWSDLRDRLAKFSLELNAEKTRLIRFGRFAAQQCQERGLGKPETFRFLGFTHICGKSRSGRFQLKCQGPPKNVGRSPLKNVGRSWWVRAGCCDWGDVSSVG
jgi:RNA-directed DNA polymerase